MGFGRGTPSKTKMLSWLPVIQHGDIFIIVVDIRLCNECLGEASNPFADGSLVLSLFGIDVLVDGLEDIFPHNHCTELL